MAFQPAESLKNKTFIGLMVAQFLAGFNDQAIHASAMFYAIHEAILTEKQAISLMPVLFYAPWAIFCTVAGYLADRYSKTTALRTWKLAEVVISLILLAGFYLGLADVRVGPWNLAIGPWVVLSTVFLMGTHAAFFAPAKYGAMPEILQPHILSRGNGVLESTTFLAAIFGTVAGGFLSFLFHGSEYWIGWVLLTLSLCGAAASFLIVPLPPASPDKRLPWNIYRPLFKNLATLFKSRPLALSVLGIAFFIFMVSYMRQTMYMHGESRNPPWNELRTSLVVACVALGVGLGSPLAGYLSGGKVELGLVPLGTLGIIGAALLAAITIELDQALIVALVIIGFFSGFYMVPLYTLLQQRAPKQSKGELIATSNFINVTGAIAASVLFYLLVSLVETVGITPELPQTEVVTGKLIEIQKDRHGKPTGISIQGPAGQTKVIRVLPRIPFDPDDPGGFIEELMAALPKEGEIQFEEDFLEVLGGGLKVGDLVVVSQYVLGEAPRYIVRSASNPVRPVYDYRGLPKFLFLGAALMALGILIVLVRKLPDFFVRMVFWMRSLGRFRIRAVGMQNLPTSGPVVLATNCDTFEASLQLVSATDRSTLVVLWENPQARQPYPLLRLMAKRRSVVEISHAGSDLWHKAHYLARKSLRRGNLLAVTVDGHATAEIEDLIKELVATSGAPILPVYVGAIDSGTKPRVRVVFGEPVAAGASLEEIRLAVRELGDWIRANDHVAVASAH